MNANIQRSESGERSRRFIQASKMYLSQLERVRNRVSSFKTKQRCKSHCRSFSVHRSLLTEVNANALIAQWRIKLLDFRGFIRPA